MTRTSIALALVLAVTLAAGSARADEPAYACKKMPAGAKMRVSLAPETSMLDLAVWLSSFTCKNVVFGSGVARRAARVTLVTPSEVTPRQAVKLFIDAAEALDLKVAEKSDTFIVKLGPGMPKACPDLAPSAFAAPAAPAATPEDTPAPAIPDAELDASIRKVDDLHYEIRRPLLDKLLADPAPLLRCGRVVPSFKNGSANGFKLFGVRPNSFCARLGFANGDTVTAINGISTATLDGALEAFDKARAASRFELSLVRRGEPITLVIAVTRGPAR